MLTYILYMLTLYMFYIRGMNQNPIGQKSKKVFCFQDLKFELNIRMMSYLCTIFTVQRVLGKIWKD